MCADAGAVDHLQGRCVGIGIGERRQHDVPDPRERPSSELLIDRVPGTKLCRKIAPRRARSCDPKDAVQRPAVIQWWSTASRTILCHERGEHRPLAVAHQSTNQACLPPRRSLESSVTQFANPVCQQNLVEGNEQGRRRHYGLLSAGNSIPACESRC